LQENYEGRIIWDFAVGTGYFLLPDNITGNLEDYGYYYSPYDVSYLDQISSDNQYYKQEYTYRHPFSKKTLANIGFESQISIFLTNELAVGFEYGKSVSISDYIEEDVLRDSIPVPINSNNPIPHDYKIQLITTRNNLYLKMNAVGVTGNYRRLYKGKFFINYGFGMGSVSYLQIFRLEYPKVELKYYQNNGNEVYSEIQSSAFNVFGIKYISYYVRPKISIEYPLIEKLVLKTSLSIPFSYVEKGYRWTEESSYDDDTIFYPSSRFMAGNFKLSFGFSLIF